MKEVSQDDFNAILERIKAAGMPYRSNVHDPADFKINTQDGGAIVYWNEPDGHQWGMLTVSYARDFKLTRSSPADAGVRVKPGAQRSCAAPQARS